MAADLQAEQDSGYDSSTCSVCTCRLVATVVVALLVSLLVFGVTSKDPVYSVTITGVAGLDDAASSSNLSPVFNLTVRIDNSRAHLDGKACIDGLSTVAVSYGDAPLAGRGSVPQFCAGGGKVRERRARAWGQGVVLPPFLRDQLAGELAAGEAAVDVTVTTPAQSYMYSDTVLVCSQAKIGGGPAPCREEKVYRQQQTNPGSTG